ncbi:MAG: hypothetical protein EOO25_19790 [Comamonadaceae bacterium]|nr:MAG: hypothetical protein EOO25_19790 [Comamonadaceae bacterium]
MLLNLLRWDAEVRAPAESALPDVTVTDKEIKMAEMLVNDLATAWSPDLFHDEFKEQVAALVQAKAARGEVAVMQAAPGQEVAQTSAEVIDLTELLKRSLQSRVTPVKTGKVGQGRAANDEPAQARRAAASKTPVKAKATVKPKSRAA